MLSYCFKCRKNTESKTPKVEKAKKRKKTRTMLSTKYVLCYIIKLRCLRARS